MSTQKTIRQRKSHGRASAVHLIVIVFCVIIQIHLTLDICANSLNPVTWFGLAYYDNLNKILPEFTINIFIYVFQSYITYILIYIVNKRINLVSCISSHIICLFILILGHYIITSYYPNIIGLIDKSNLGKSYYNLYEYDVLHNIVGYCSLQILILCFYWVSQYIIIKKKLQDMFQWAEIRWVPWKHLW